MLKFDDSNVDVDLIVRVKESYFLHFSDITSDTMCGSFTCSKNTLVGLNVIYILVSFLMIGVAVHSKYSYK